MHNSLLWYAGQKSFAHHIITEHRCWHDCIRSVLLSQVQWLQAVSIRMGSRGELKFCHFHRFQWRCSVDVFMYCRRPAIEGTLLLFLSNKKLRFTYFNLKLEPNFRIFLIKFQIRTVGMTICMVCMNITSFICLKLFPILMTIIGLHGCMLTLATACIIGSSYVYFAVKETKGISMDSIGSKAGTKWIPLNI